MSRVSRQCCNILFNLDWSFVVCVRESPHFAFTHPVIYIEQLSDYYRSCTLTFVRVYWGKDTLCLMHIVVAWMGTLPVNVFICKWLYFSKILLESSSHWGNITSPLMVIFPIFQGCNALRQNLFRTTLQCKFLAFSSVVLEMSWLVFYLLYLHSIGTVNFRHITFSIPPITMLHIVTKRFWIWVVFHHLLW